MMQKQKWLWVTDPWTTLDLLQDTTLRLATEALNLGIDSYWSASDLVLNASPSHLKVIPIDAKFITQFNPLDLKNAVEIHSSKFCQLHYRVDPPVDLNYTSLLEALLAQGVSESIICNPKAVISLQSEKVPPAELKAITPLHRVISDKNSAQEAFQAFLNHEQLVSKPMNLAQSLGVEKWKNPKNWSEFESKVATLTHQFQTPILLEEYLPDVMNGEVRMWFAKGEFIAALKKYPKTGDFRVLVDEGSKLEAYELSNEEKKSARLVSQSLVSQNISLAAIDFISNKISDYNLTSPGLLVQLEKLHGQNFAKKIIEILLRK